MNSIKAPQIHIKRNVIDDKYKHVPKDYMKVAEGMEAQFTNHLLAQMNKTIDLADDDSQAQKIYKSLLNDERAQLMAKSNSGLGVKDMVLDQIYPQYKLKNRQDMINSYQSINSQKGETDE